MNNRQLKQPGFALFLRLLIALGLVRVLLPFFEFKPQEPKADFNSRYNEALCLRAGYDPYDVFTKKVSIPGVVSMADLENARVPEPPKKLPSFPDFGKDAADIMVVHAYPPWSYAWMLPWTYVSRQAAWWIHLALEIVSIAVLFFVPWRYLARGGDDDNLPWLAFLAFALNLGKVFPATFLCGNYSTFVAAGVMGMAWFLDRGRQVPAGFCFALAMLKPQIGAIFAIPLFLGRRFRTVAVAAALCFGGAVAVSLYCDASVFDLIRHANAAGPRFFYGTALLPTRFLDTLGISIGSDAAVPLCAAAGGTACAFVSWRVSNRQSWMIRLAPAAVCSLFWMVARTYDHAIDLLPLAVAMPVVFNKKNNMRALRIATFVALLPLLMRNLNPEEGGKIRYIAQALSGVGLDIFPIVHMRTAAARWSWAYQPMLLVPLAFLLAESLRRFGSDVSLARKPDATRNSK